MSDSIVKEVEFLGYSVLTGILILVLYDVLRILRRVFSHSAGAVGAEDFLYWMVVTFCIFSMMFQENNGAIRWFSVAGIFSGMLLYNMTVSAFFVRYTSFFFLKIRKRAERIFSFLLKPLKKQKKALKRRAKTLKIIITKNRPKREGRKHGKRKGSREEKKKT